MNKPIERTAAIREWRLTWSMLTKSKITIVSTIVLGLLIVLASLAPWISPYPPNEMHYDDEFLPPSTRYPLGTDYMGRDILSRTLYGARASIFASIGVVGLSLAIGVPLGAVSGYFGRRVDEILMRTTDIIMSFPGVTLAMLLAYSMGRGIFSAAFALGLVGWTTTARIVRSVVLSEKERDYVTAARVVGKKDFRILFSEVMPNCLYPVIVDAMIRMGTTIIALAGLSFIGVAVQPPDPDLGVAVSEGRLYIMDYPMLSILPGVVILAVVLAYNMIGDRLRDALDPRLRREIVGPGIATLAT